MNTGCWGILAICALVFLLDWYEKKKRGPVIISEEERVRAIVDERKMEAAEKDIIGKAERISLLLGVDEDRARLFTRGTLRIEHASRTSASYYKNHLQIFEADLLVFESIENHIVPELPDLEIRVYKTGKWLNLLEQFYAEALQKADRESEIYRRKALEDLKDRFDIQ
jgi:hypothetical protein